MKELQLLINKWKLEAESLKSNHRQMFNHYHPLTSEYKRLRKCINEAESLLVNENEKSSQSSQEDGSNSGNAM